MNRQQLIEKAAQLTDQVNRGAEALGALAAMRSDLAAALAPIEGRMVAVVLGDSYQRCRPAVYRVAGGQLVEASGIVDASALDAR